MSYLK